MDSYYMAAVVEDSLKIHRVHSTAVALAFVHDVVVLLMVVLIENLVVAVVAALMRFARNLDTKMTMNCCYVLAILSLALKLVRL